MSRGRFERHRRGQCDTGKERKHLPEGGTLNAVKIVKPVYILEPSGRYRATADMSIGGGAVGSVALGAARARVEIATTTALLSTT